MKSVSGFVRTGLVVATLGLSACAVYPAPAPYYAEPAYSYYPAPAYYYPAPAVVAPSISLGFWGGGGWGHGGHGGHGHWR